MPWIAQETQYCSLRYILGTVYSANTEASEISPDGEKMFSSIGLEGKSACRSPGSRIRTDSCRLDHVADGEPLDGLILGSASRAVAAPDGVDVAAAYELRKSASVDDDEVSQLGTLDAEMHTLLVAAVVLSLLDHFGGFSSAVLVSRKVVRLEGRNISESGRWFRRRLTKGFKAVRFLSPTIDWRAQFGGLKFGTGLLNYKTLRRASEKVR